MPTYYNEQEKKDVDFIIRLGKSVWNLQAELELQKIHLEAVKIKVRQFEAMTGVSSMNLPHESKTPDWGYMLKHTNNREK